MTCRRLAIGLMALVALLVVYFVLTYFGTSSVQTGTGTVPG
jgi:hypothetical protein